MALKHAKSGVVVNTYVTNEELVGSRSSLEEFRRELSQFPSATLLRICSALNILLFGWSRYLDKNVHDRLVATLCPTAFRAIKDEPTRGLIHRQQLLLIAKEAVRIGSDAVSPPAVTPDLTRLFTMANDQFAGPEPHTDKEAKDPIRLVSQFLVVSELQFPGGAAQVFRPYITLSKLKELAPRDGRQFDISKMFEATVGLLPEIYFPLVFGCMTKYQPLNAEHFFRSPKDFALHIDWFNQTRLDGETLNRFFRDVSADYAEFKQILTRLDRGVSDFSVFRERPMVRLGDLLYPVDFGFLAAKAETAFFWRAHNALLPKERDQFHSFWGEIFEHYMHRLLERSVDGEINRYYKSPKYRDRQNEEAWDGVMICQGHVAVVMEFKGSVFTANAKYGGDLEALKDEIDKKLIGQKGRRPERREATGVWDLERLPAGALFAGHRHFLNHQGVSSDHYARRDRQHLLSDQLFE